MRVRQLVSVLGVVVVILSMVSLPSVKAQDLLSPEHLLFLLPEDVAALGSTDVLIPDTQLDKESDRSVMAGWEEAHTMSFSVGSTQTKECALVDSYSYKYASPQAAQQAFQVARKSTTLAQDGASLLSETSMRILQAKSTAWSVRQGKDSG